MDVWVRSVQHDLYGVVGRPARHSFSPAMMRAAFATLGIDACYLALEADDFREALDVLERLGFRGLSITVPFKQDAFTVCGRVDASARSIGAVNTLRLTESGWEGRNTDWLGAARALERVVSLRGASALVIGAGGAARGVVYGLLERGAEVLVVNRTDYRARDLAETFGCAWAPLGELPLCRPNIVVHTTRAGMSGTPYDFTIPKGFFSPHMVVMDIVYAPLETPLLHRAKAAGARVVDGLEMLLYQGVEQLSWWLNRPAPESAMREALRRAAALAGRKVSHE